MTTDWDARWLELATHIASWSKDRSTKVGSVIIGSGRQILSAGYNGFPRGVNDDTLYRHERPAKYKWTEHAERNAIYNAARHGVGLSGSTLYVPLYPCADCARGIIQVGITTVVVPQPDPEDFSGFDDRWAEDHRVARIMLGEAGVDVHVVTFPLTDLPGSG